MPSPRGFALRKYISGNPAGFAQVPSVAQSSTPPTATVGGGGGRPGYLGGTDFSQQPTSSGSVAGASSPAAANSSPYTGINTNPGEGWVKKYNPNTYSNGWYNPTTGEWK